MWPGWWQEVLELSAVYKARHDNQLNDTQHKDTRHDNNQQNDIQHTDVRQTIKKTKFNDTQLTESVIRVLYVWCCNTKCQCADRCYAECHGAL